MGKNAGSDRVGSMVKSNWMALVALSTAALVGCGGGDGSVGVGSGQDPDPAAVDFPIAYTKGPLFDEDMELQSNTDLRDVLRFNVGTDLYIRDRASPTAVERNITLKETEGLGDVMGVEMSVDGKKALFAMRGPFDPDLDDEDQPTWNIWEYEIATQTLRRIIASDITAEAGQDIAPYYLADGRIIFSSTRQRQSKAILLDEGKPQFEAMDEEGDNPAFVLHVMDADGANLHQVSFNQSNDLDPTLLDNGRVLFSRWDHAGGVNGIHLYTMNPDGSDLQLYYGAESHMTGTDDTEVQFVDARQMLDGKIMAIVRPFDHPELGGAITVIDAPTYVENTQPIAAFRGLQGPAQKPATPNQVRTDLQASQGGRYSSAFPLWDGTARVLVSWEICRLLEDNEATADPTDSITAPCTEESLRDPDAEPAPPLYGIWMYDPIDKTQLPIVIGEEGVLIGDVVAAQPRRNPQAIPDKVAGAGADATLVAEGVGILNIRSVYDVDGEDVLEPSIAVFTDPAVTIASDRPARFLRIEKAVSIPDEDIVDLDRSAFGPNIRQGMREIVGYAPVEPDGSVRIKVPANVALAVSVLDGYGRSISSRHRNWLQVMPGEEVRCTGCHVPASGLSHGRRGTFDSAYPGATGAGVAFPNSVATLSPADVGETMAETRTRIDRTALEPSVDLIYEDVWSIPALHNGPLEYRYSGLTTLAPLGPNCGTNWTASCRIVIHYRDHIHPLWSEPRPAGFESDGVTPIDRSCAQSGCHAPVDANNAPMVPAADLDLSDLSPAEADQLKAYRELLFGDNQEEIVNGAAQDLIVDSGRVDEDGNPIFVPVGVPPPLSSAGANASIAFFDLFDPNKGGSHEGYLTTDELRLISEWLDIGAQYYNDPFFEEPVM